MTTPSIEFTAQGAHIIGHPTLEQWGASHD